MSLFLLLLVWGQPASAWLVTPWLITPLPSRLPPPPPWSLLPQMRPRAPAAPAAPQSVRSATGSLPVVGSVGSVCRTRCPDPGCHAAATPLPGPGAGRPARVVRAVLRQQIRQAARVRGPPRAAGGLPERLPVRADRPRRGAHGSGRSPAAPLLRQRPLREACGRPTHLGVARVPAPGRLHRRALHRGRGLAGRVPLHGSHQPLQMCPKERRGGHPGSAAGRPAQRRDGEPSQLTCAHPAIT